MELSPRYEAPPLIDLGSADGAVGPALVSQRRRMVESLAEFGPQEWSRPSRCAGWSAADVAVHLEGTNQFWVLSIDSALAGEPTRFLADFDPVATPAAMVAAGAGRAPEEVFEGLAASSEALTDLVSSITGADWALMAESPPGHVSIDALAHHALWDSWIHERDVMLPSGAEPERVDDEIAAALRYAAVLGPALAVAGDPAVHGTLAVRGTAPSVSFVVEADTQVRLVGEEASADVVLSGDAVELLEALSIRAPMEGVVDRDILGGPHGWMFAGLAEVFDS